MDGDDDTTMFVTYKDKTHNLGIVDRDKFSRVSVINKVMVRVYGRKMLFDERFNMSIWQPWDCKKAQIDTDTDLISQLKEHNHHLIYYMQLYLDKIPQNHDSTTKRVLFESFKPNSSRDPDTNNPATLNLNDPITLPLHVSTNPIEFSNEKLLPELKATIPITVTTNIMKSLVASDSIQSQSNSQKSPLPFITKIQNKIDANSDLFEDFMDTYFRSPTQNQTTIRTQTEAVTQTQTSDTEHTDEVSDNNGDNTSCYTPESPSQQLPQNFAQSRNLSLLLNDCPSSHEETDKASEAAFISLDQNDMVSFLQTQNPESQPIFASNPFNNSSDHGNILNSKAAVGAEYDLDDNVFSLIDGDEDPEHPFGTPNVIKPLTKIVLESKMACVVSDDSDGDYILSDYKSGDDDCGLVSDDESDGVLAKMEAVIRENLYIPSWDFVTFRIGMYFRNFRELAWAIRQHAVENKFKVYRHKFERARITVGYAYYKCPWFLHAGRTRFGSVYLLKRLHNVHTCSRELDNPECTAEFIVVKYEQTFLDHPDTKVDFIIDEMRRIYSCKVNRFKVYRAKKMALQRAGADHESSYRLIRSYAQIILNKMPQALALVSVIRFSGEQSQTHFDRFILSFPALRDGFKAGCRLFIGIDGCHLKGPYKGVMLSAVALDANTGIFPVAVCVCSVESTSTWTWFLGHLKTFLEDARQLTFICDRQKGIQNALALEFPNAHVRDFDVAMTNLKNIDEGVYETLRRLPPKFWARHAFDNSCKSDHCTNNMTESFNAWLGVQRKVPLLNMLEWMRKKLMKRLVNRRKKAEAWESEIPKRIYDRMMNNLQIGSPNPVAQGSEWLYEVDHNHRTYIVDLQHHGSYLRTYAGMIHPIPDKSSWPITPGDEIYPPLVKRPPGRPKMNRRREADEVPPEKKRYMMQCKCCKQFGHNKRGCPINPLNANKRTKHYKTNLKQYMTKTGSTARGLQDRLVGPLSSVLGRGSTTVIHMQPYEHVRTTVEMANIEVNAPWLGVQGRKIMAVGGISLRENQTTNKKSELNNIGKGKAPAFPPEMVVNSVAGGASSDTSSNASGCASSWA
ncbi:SWIM-type domain-containing protein [Citrus sinensis]|nr:SWIM-type domain-containing protein [Citrus sinensis]